MICALAIGLLGKVLHNSIEIERSFRLLLLSEIATSIFGVTAYLYTKSYLHKKGHSKKDLVHYIPSVLYCLSLFVYFILPTPEVLKVRRESGEITRVIFLVHAYILAINITYLVFAFGSLSQFKKRYEQEVSYFVSVKFFKYFLSSLAFLFVLWLGSYIYSVLILNEVMVDIRLYIWLAMCLVVLLFSIYALTSPQSLLKLPELTEKKYANSKYTADDLEKLQVKLDQIMQEKKPYLNSKLLKSELAKLLGVSNPDLARLLNERIGMSFFEYINYHRIQEFVLLMKSDKAETMTFFGLAQEAGFNSKTTFNKSFKKLIGVTPSQYFKDLGKS